MTKKNRKKWGIAAAAGAAGLLGIVFLALACRSDRNVVCYIDGEPIYKEEIAIAASSVELAAEQKFADASGQSVGNVDWSKTAGGKSGYEYLGEAVEQELIRIKEIQIEAKKNGICDEVTYPEMEKKREAENRQRAAVKSEQGVVYGVVSFDEEEYYRYSIDNLDLQNKRYLTQEGVLTASEKEIKEKYEKDPSAFDNQEYETVCMFVKNTVLSEKYEKYMDRLEQNAEVKGKDRMVSFLEKWKG